jgi:hypothetical protein
MISLKQFLIEWDRGDHALQQQYADQKKNDPKSMEYFKVDGNTITFMERAKFKSDEQKNAIQRLFKSLSGKSVKVKDQTIKIFTPQNLEKVVSLALASDMKFTVL